MRLIDADALDEALTKLRFNADGEIAHWGDRKDWCLHGSEIEKLIANAPTVDAEPVVRCKDCKHYIADGCDECELMSAKSIIASINNKRWHSDFYCAWGERREGTDD